jgi:hypothetical protein
MPNLETKFVAANTLIGLDKPQQMTLMAGEVERLEKELSSIRHKIFFTRKYSDKKALKKTEKAKREELQTALTQTGYTKNTATQMAGWNPFYPMKSAKFFDSETMFGFKDGFNVVIGNPPFIAGKSGIFNSQEKKYFNEKYESAEYQLDTYILFTEKGVKLCAEKGLTSFILPNTWLANLKLTKIRKFLLENTILLNIVINPNDVFETAVVDTIILITAKGKNINNILKLGTFNELKYQPTSQLDQNSFKINEKYIFDIQLNKKSKNIVSKIEEGCEKVNDLCDVNRGVHAYRKDGFGKSKFEDGYQTERDYNEQSYHSTWRIDKTYFKEVRGKNIFPYHFEYSDRWISWGDWLAESRDWKFFSGERIYLRKIVGNTLFAAYVNDENVADQSVYIAKVKNQDFDTKYLLALLNSKLITWYFRVKANEFDDLFPQIKVTEFKELPIKYSKEQSKFIKIIDYIIYNKALKKDSVFFVSLINAMVYELYLPEPIKAAGCEVLKYLDNLPELKEGEDENNLKIIEKVYKELSDPGHPISAALLKLLNVEEVNIIEGRS